MFGARTYGTPSRDASREYPLRSVVADAYRQPLSVMFCVPLIAGPDGHDAKAGKPGKGGLIGRVGYNGKPFRIGSANMPILMPKSGELFLGINDFIFGDNAGAFTVTILQPGRP
jgi:hypothetical protein